MSVERLEVGQLRALDMLLRERHLTRAAERLGLSQPALSHALGRLRALTKDELFVRTPRGMTPTPHALALGPEVREILARIERILEPSSVFEPRRLARTFVLGTADFVELRLVPELLRVLAEEAPGVDLMVRPQAAVSEEDLEAGRADLLIGVFTARSASMVERKVFDEGFLSVVRKGHPVVRKKLSLELFVALPHVQIAPRGLPGGPVDDALAALGLSRRVALKVPSFLPALRVAASSELILTAPAGLVRDAVRDLPLVPHPTPVHAKPFPLSVAWHERVQRDPAHAWLRGHVIRILERGAGKRRTHLGQG